MKKTEFLLEEVYELSYELSGAQNNPGLLGEEINLVTKFWLEDLNAKVKDRLKASNTLRDDLIKKYGVKDDQENYSIAQTIGEGEKQKVNPKFLKFNEEFNALLKEKVTLEHYEFKINDIADVKTSNSYRVFFKLLKKPNE